MEALAQLREALADRYAIDREIGAGGMATVYLARDLRHDRPVALKLLDPELGAVLGVERFLAEIKVTANLQHPNLLPLFDSGAVGGHLFYVMPFVDGESLRVRLDREKQLPIDDALRIAVAAANGLDYAHSQGVIHRDLKPENILLQAGQPVIADFGIALAVSKAGGHRITQTGLSLGTPQYMSPEQATGDRVIDGRSDIYSLAAVVYEMLAGEPPHIGHTAQAIIARVLTDKPRPIRNTRGAVPEHVEAAIDRALQKLPADRFGTAREFGEALQGRGPIATTTRLPAAAQTRAVAGWRGRLRDPVVIGLAVVALVAMAGAATVVTRPAARDQLGTIRFRFTGPDSARAGPNFPWPAAISRDGSQLVYAVRSARGTQLYLRRLDQLEPRPIPGTVNGSQPVFSPNGQWLAFEALGKEQKVRLDGSAPVTIAAGGANNGADWTIRGDLVVGSTGRSRGLSRVSVAGGELSAFTHPDTAKGEIDHLWPIALDDGDTFAFIIWRGALATAQLGIASLDGDFRPLGLKGIRPLARLDNSLVYVQHDGAVMAVPLDIAGKRLAGSPVPVHDPVRVQPNNNGNSDVFVSQGGAQVSAVGIRAGKLSWLSPRGATQPISDEVRDFQRPRLAPDDRRIAVIVGDGAQRDVWLYDIPTGTLSRLTHTGSVTSVEWSADGKQVIYSAAGQDSRGSVWSQAVDVATPPKELYKFSQLTPDAFLAPDGKSLLASTLGLEGWDIVYVPVDSSAAPQPFGSKPASEQGPRISPDGRWAAHSSDESGRDEIYIRSFPDPAVKLQVSVGGGVGATWSADSKRLYYLSGNSILSARLETGATVRVIGRDTAFRLTQGTDIEVGFGAAEFDVNRDGSHAVVPASISTSFELIVVPNWIREFRERMAASRR